MIKIELSAANVSELKKMMKELIGEEAVTNFTEPDVHVSDNNVEEDEQDEPVVAAPKKSRVKKVAATAPKPQVAPPVVDVPPALPTETPQHFYSLNEFQANMAMIITELLSVGALDQTYLNVCTNLVGESFIYAAAKTPEKSEQIYEKMVTDGIITRKGNY